MNGDYFARDLLELGPLTITDTLVVSLALSVLLAGLGAIAMRFPGPREVLEVAYETLERSVREMVAVDAGPLVPLVLTLWAFILSANLVGLLPLVSSPTRDLSITTALALISFFAGHVFAFRQQGWRYLKHYLKPNPLMLPFNIIGELSRTLALALRLFGNILSGELIAAILLYVAGLLLPVPLMLLSVLTAVVQAYIFGVLTLVFAASSVHVVAGSPPGEDGGEEPPPSSPANPTPTLEGTAS
ncbi:MAG TPA: F0F1 ATP synthase subunit A [Polyangiaceae bacterium LLY-WYZ-15_(1-7)]|nr:ATP synthase F0 subunit A [Sandaracinus sp.]HJK94728.1 F0F1 ATP synthase subunit A [Polyangiaceae bacterium LLY-WYZ-15_(1-7)]MBJ73946.1 ATP synthase F0 subunit A [Sandaracinus sp.]HJL00584.1 F0F1 ATP synthase subunit A [Polyangiaceae bacterium LLY-WYZ-15_(1-7)]HJL07179.1 F0F1 ATP synthase subunit A [Polyangiaceae bacterium LLY-WYZ-15_(1-7)]